MKIKLLAGTKFSVGVCRLRAQPFRYLQKPKPRSDIRLIRLPENGYFPLCVRVPSSTHGWLKPLRPLALSSRQSVLIQACTGSKRPHVPLLKGRQKLRMGRLVSALHYSSRKSATGKESRALEVPFCSHSGLYTTFLLYVEPSPRYGEIYWEASYCAEGNCAEGTVRLRKEKEAGRYLRTLSKLRLLRRK